MFVFVNMGGHLHIRVVSEQHDEISQVGADSILESLAY